METIQEAAQFKVELCKSMSLLMNEIKYTILCIQVIYISNIIKNMHFLAKSEAIHLFIFPRHETPIVHIGKY